MEIVKLSSKNYKEVLRKSAEAVKKGEVLIYPTDTIYGLVCDATNKKAIEKLFKIKKRPKGKKIPIFIKDIKMAKKLAQISKSQEQFLKQVWPGRVTVVLRAKTKGTIGLRVPDYRMLLGVAEQLNKPLTGTSANVSGQPGSTKIKKILKQFEKQKNKPDLVVDAGNLPKSKPSTVIDLTIWPPKILRA